MATFLAPAKKLFAILALGIVFPTCRKNVQSSSPADIPAAFLRNPVPVSFQINEAFGGYYIALPDEYMESGKNYPAIIFLHGAGQTGNGTSELNYILNDGIGKILQKEKFPAAFRVAENRYSFIVASPQYARPPNMQEMAELIGYFKKTYRIDERRIYLAGLSLGARIATLAAADSPSTFAALVAIAGVANNAGMVERCDSIATHNLPVWAFHNIDDPMADVSVTERFIDLIRGFSPPTPPRLTIFDVYGHDAWTTALDPSYREDGMNIYEWMLQYSR